MMETDHITNLTLRCAGDRRRARQLAACAAFVRDDSYKSPVVGARDAASVAGPLPRASVPLVSLSVSRLPCVDNGPSARSFRRHAWRGLRAHSQPSQRLEADVFTHSDT